MNLLPSTEKKTTVWVEQLKWPESRTNRSVLDIDGVECVDDGGDAGDD
jgi:hypothetical protein